MEGMTNVRARQKTHKQNDRQRENVHIGGGKSQAMLKVKPTLHSDLKKDEQQQQKQNMVKEMYKETTLFCFSKVQKLSLYILKCSKNSECLKLLSKTN